MSTAKSTKSAKSKASEGSESSPTVTRFDEFRDRAVSMSGINKEATVTDKPFVLGPEDGFDPPLSLDKPGFIARANIQDAMRKKDTVSILNAVFGREAMRVAEMTDRYERQTGASGDAVVSGIIIAYMEHFFGKGAGGQAFISALI